MRPHTGVIFVRRDTIWIRLGREFTWGTRATLGYIAYTIYDVNTHTRARARTVYMEALFTLCLKVPGRDTLSRNLAIKRGNRHVLLLRNCALLGRSLHHRTAFRS